MSLVNEIYEYVKTVKTMQLATVSDFKPWICTVYFVLHEGRVYWLSLPTRRHSEELAKQPQAAVAFAVKTDKPVTGVQAEGSVGIVTDKALVKAVCDLYIEKYNQAQDFYESFAGGTNQHNVYCFVPENWVLFDENNHPDTPRQECRP